MAVHGKQSVVTEDLLAGAAWLDEEQEQRKQPHRSCTAGREGTQRAAEATATGGNAHKDAGRCDTWKAEDPAEAASTLQGKPRRGGIWKAQNTPDWSCRQHARAAMRRQRTGHRWNGRKKETPQSRAGSGTAAAARHGAWPDGKEGYSTQPIHNGERYGKGGNAMQHHPPTEARGRRPTEAAEVERRGGRSRRWGVTAEVEHSEGSA